jgi:hypothetical protein
MGRFDLSPLMGYKRHSVEIAETTRLTPKRSL